MSKGVVPHPKSYRKVGVEEWMDYIERLAPGFKRASLGYAASCDEDDASSVRRKAVSDVRTIAGRLYNMENTMIASGIDGRASVSYFQFPLSFKEFELFGIWQQTRQVFSMNPFLLPEVAIDDECEIPTYLFEQMPYPVMYLQLNYEDTEDELAVDMDENGHLITHSTKMEYKHDGVLLKYEKPLLVVEDFYRYRRVDPDGHVEDFEPIYGMSPHHINVADSTSLGEAFAQDKKSRLSFERMEEELQSLRASFGVSPWKVARNDDSVDLVIAYQSAVSREKARNNLLSRVLGSLIYICSTNADMEPMYVPSQSRKRSRGKDETQATVTAVGYREGLALGQARARHEREVAEIEPEAPVGTHRSPTPHWRRGYFGHRWCGSGEDRHLEVRWVSPAAVGFKRDAQNEIVTFHAVEPSVSELQEEVR